MSIFNNKKKQAELARQAQEQRAFEEKRKFEQEYPYIDTVGYRFKYITNDKGNLERRYPSYKNNDSVRWHYKKIADAQVEYGARGKIRYAGFDRVHSTGDLYHIRDIMLGDNPNIDYIQAGITCLLNISMLSASYIQVVYEALKDLIAMRDTKINKILDVLNRGYYFEDQYLKYLLLGYTYTTNTSIAANYPEYKFPIDKGYFDFFTEEEKNHLLRLNQYNKTHFPNHTCITRNKELSDPAYDEKHLIEQREKFIEKQESAIKYINRYKTLSKSDKKVQKDHYKENLRISKLSPEEVVPLSKIQEQRINYNNAIDNLIPRTIKEDDYEFCKIETNSIKKYFNVFDENCANSGYEYHPEQEHFIMKYQNKFMYSSTYDHRAIENLFGLSAYAQYRIDQIKVLYKNKVCDKEMVKLATSFYQTFAQIFEHAVLTSDWEMLYKIEQSMDKMACIHVTDKAHDKVSHLQQVREQIAIGYNSNNSPLTPSIDHKLFELQRWEEFYNMHLYNYDGYLTRKKDGIHILGDNSYSQKIDIINKIAKPDGNPYVGFDNSQEYTDMDCYRPEL